MCHPRLVKPVCGLLGVVALFVYLVFLVLTLHSGAAVRDTVAQYASNGWPGFLAISCGVVAAVGADIGAILFNIRHEAALLTTLRIGPDDGSGTCWSDDTKLEKVYPVVALVLAGVWLAALVPNSGFKAEYETAIDVEHVVR